MTPRSCFPSVRLSARRKSRPLGVRTKPCPPRQPRRLQASASADLTSPGEQALANPVELSGPDPSGNAKTSDIVGPESSLKVLLRLAAGARFFRSAGRAAFCPGAGRRPPRDLRAQVDGIP